VMTLASQSASNVNDAVVFHAHQGVEKMLKAVLVSRHVAPPRTHDLTTLVGMLPNLVSDGSLAEVCIGLQALWPASRYPEEPMPTRDDVTRAVAWAAQAKAILGAQVVRSADR
jgi:HEPN domain-containing protein